MTTPLAAAMPEAGRRRTSAALFPVIGLSEAARAARVNRVRARESRAMAAACELRTRRAPGQSAMYLREALRLRREAAALDVDAALHEAAVAAFRQLISDGVVPHQAATRGDGAGRH